MYHLQHVGPRVHVEKVTMHLPLLFCTSIAGKTFTYRNIQAMGKRSKHGGGATNRGRGRQAALMKKPSVDPFAGPKVMPHEPTSTLNGKGVSILWFRNDLRLRDNAALALANTAEFMLPLYVFDTSQFGDDHLSPYKFQRTGPFRANFLKQAVLDVRDCLILQGNDMLIRYGDIRDALDETIEKLAAHGVEAIHLVAHKETTWEETRAEIAVEKRLQELGDKHNVSTAAHYVWGATMHHIDDLPFNAGGASVPATFTAYRKWMESEDGPLVRDEIELADKLIKYPFGLMLKSEIPSLGDDLGVQGVGEPNDYPFPDHRAVMGFVGGPSAGEKRVNEYLWEAQGLTMYKETRNESGTRNYSSKFSPWLALGCLSPRTVYWQVKEFELEVAGNDSTYWMVFELLTRDYFHWLAASVGTKLFALNGYSGDGDRPIWTPRDISAQDRERLQRWIDGETGAPFVDASMRELKYTGFMSNRGRQNCASFLIHTLDFPDWRAGAEYFECMLIDHDVASNWGNWAYIAGVGSDPRGGRRFNVVKQSYDYDPTGWFIHGWIPELARVPPPHIHEPHLMGQELCDKYKVEQGVSYPLPIVQLPRNPKKASAPGKRER